MNTEPPEGDDLQRMLVSMKHEVLTRVDRQRPLPRRRGRHVGIVIGVIAVLGIGVGSGAVALGLVPQPFEAAAPAPSSTPTEPPAPSTPAAAPIENSPSVTPTPASTNTDGVLPTDCRALVPTSDYDRLFNATPLRDPAGTAWGDARIGPTPSMWCVWMDPRADVSGLDIAIGQADAAELREYEADLTHEGYACSDRDDGRICQMTRPADPYPVDTTLTFFARGSTWVDISQTNFPTDGLLRAVEQQVWG
ncbi:hypothetical protein EDF24_1313 [Curtobacterium sp. PhB130]|uniref:hypothetical protein n=1 Tax=unclassified Curtobacterium TaxID=257496 RepID=UPI000F4C7412|nr:MULTISPECIES: hypothetical protein [unclassified Curtobacterium]ROP61147.1 hypothetical protein EDF55_3154 [Curtobacterium sp. ZW137]ROS75742.1 hypothetical protein EDF24_1313 [Curtobacterium sp. PhB130]